ncbi:MAG: YdeI/OmpD-associated family protein [Candidatus Acidiferrum sp.]
MPRKTAPRSFVFSVPLVKPQSAPIYILEIPQRVSAAIGRRGPVPIVARLNGAVEIQASLVPLGGGRHRLQLNQRIRLELDITPGDLVRVSLTVPEKPPVLAVPKELGSALKENDLQETFSRFPAGKQNHIIQWIDEAAHPQTRERRVAKTIEVTFRARERAYERKIRTK